LTDAARRLFRVTITKSYTNQGGDPRLSDLGSTVFAVAVRVGTGGDSSSNITVFTTVTLAGNAPASVGAVEVRTTGFGSGWSLTLPLQEPQNRQASNIQTEPRAPVGAIGDSEGPAPEANPGLLRRLLLDGELWNEPRREGPRQPTPSQVEYLPEKPALQKHKDPKPAPRRKPAAFRLQVTLPRKAPLPVPLVVTWVTAQDPQPVPETTVYTPVPVGPSGGLHPTLAAATVLVGTRIGRPARPPRKLYRQRRPAVPGQLASDLPGRSPR